jgi:TrmH family RNA methyltransferase
VVALMSPEIASPANPRVRAAAELRERRERDRSGRILIDGARELLRALDAGVTIETIFVCQPLCRTDACRLLLRRLGANDPRLVPVSEPAFQKVAFGDRAEGVVAVAVRPGTDLAGLIVPTEPLVAVVEAVEKPGNLGAIMRTADGAGVDAVIAADPRTDLFNPNGIRASLGTIFGVPLAAAPTSETLAWLHDREMRIIVARVDGTAVYTDTDLRGAVAIVLGSEAEGLSPAWAGPDVTAVRLPMLGMADSLNVSVAAAVLLYEARRQRGLPGRRRRAPAARRTIARQPAEDHG